MTEFDESPDDINTFFSISKEKKKVERTAQFKFIKFHNIHNSILIDLIAVTCCLDDVIWMKKEKNIHNHACAVRIYLILEPVSNAFLVFLTLSVVLCSSPNHFLLLSINRDFNAVFFFFSSKERREEKNKPINNRDMYSILKNTQSRRQPSHSSSSSSPQKIYT